MIVRIGSVTYIGRKRRISGAFRQREYLRGQAFPESQKHAATLLFYHGKDLAEGYVLGRQILGGGAQPGD